MELEPEGIAPAEADVQAGRTFPQSEVFQDLRARLTEK